MKIHILSIANFSLRLFDSRKYNIANYVLAETQMYAEYFMYIV